MEWQPIETAPKDGTLILIFEPMDSLEKRRTYWDEEQIKMYGNGTKVARWRATDYNRKRNPDGTTTYTPSEWGWVEPYEDYFQFEPTHWMPLPTPPQAKA